MRNNNRLGTSTAVLLTAAIWVGCGESAPSASIQEAQKIHEQLDRVAAEFHDELQLTIGDTEARIASSLEEGDSLLALQLARAESQLDALDLRFHDWESTVAPLPGATCDHDHDHAQDHAHGHDHGTGASLEGMSDEAILEIQQALMAALTTMKATLQEVQQVVQAQQTTDDAE
ncbi:hypothetical protein OAF30_00495 [Flavobacteriales bacterium]|nr:hypothetical protein [Flavobacteriales bacterium]